MVDLKPSRLLVNLTHKKLWLTFNPWEWQASNFSSCHENKGNYHQLKKLLITRQILLVSTLVNVQRVLYCRVWKELLVPKKIVVLYQCTGKRHSWERLGDVTWSLCKSNKTSLGKFFFFPKPPNPLIPKSDYQLISPNNITPESNITGKEKEEKFSAINLG